MIRRRICSDVQTHLSGIKIFSTLRDDESTTTNVNALIGTHHGTFHCDEALACALLLHTEQYAQANILRTRNLTWLTRCTIVVDVGAEYDASRHRYDHHQNSFEEKMTTEHKTYTATKLSSAGLIYRHFGLEILHNFTRHLVEIGAISVVPSPEELNVLYDKVYVDFVEHVDGNDNGVEPYRSTTEGGTVKSTYSVRTALPARVSYLNPSGAYPCSDEEANSSFAEAMVLCATEFYQTVARIVCKWLPSRAQVQKALLTAYELHSSGQVICLEESGVQWKEHLSTLEKKEKKTQEILYVLSPDPTSGTWRVMAVPISPSSFTSRCPLAHQGLRDEELSKAFGIEQCIFVHASGFIGGNQTREGALAMAIASLPDRKGGDQG